MTSQKTAAELEHEIASQRAYLALTLDKITARMTPGQVLDEAWEFARDSGGGEFVRNFGTSVRDNPLPVGLITAGIAWLMSGRSGRLPSLSRGNGAARERIVRGDRLDTSYDGYAGADRRTSARERLGRAAGAAGEAAQVAMEDTREGVDNLRRSAGESFRWLKDSAGERSRQMRDRAATFADEQPVLLAVTGLAIGALVGAMARSTPAETRLMGKASDRVRNRAMDAAASGVDNAADAVERTYEAAQDEAGREGQAAGDSGGEAADEPTRKARRAARKGKDQPEEEFDAASGSTTGAS